MGFAQQLVLICTFIPAACILAVRSDEPKAVPSFSSFMASYGRSYAPGSKEYEMRRSLYQHRLEEVQRHNSKPHRRWNAAVNHLSDRTDVELAQLRGLRIVQASRRTRSPGSIGAHRSGQFLGQVKSSVLPEEKSWQHLSALNVDFDQAACGSCWAIATATMLQANAEIKGYNRTFSAQELVDCVPNPHNCGGSGGCDGATVELAMNWAMDKGLATSETTPYKGMDQACLKKQDTSFVSETHNGNSLDDMVAVGFHGAESPSGPAMAMGLTGWERLPENEYEPLIRSVAEVGPAAVSVAASGWSSYGAGIFDDCNKDAVIDHAVTLIGYGTDKIRNEKYWTIKNSWGLTWGEAGGTIRLLRKEGNVHCGTDYQPKVGTGCDGGPSSVPVCGMCGILYDSVVPRFEPSKK